MSIRRALGLVLSILLIAAPRAAFAHAHLVRSSPFAGARISATPHMIQLWFSEAPEAALTAITLATANGRVIPLGAVTAVPDTSVSVMTAVNAALTPGDYTVTWRTVAADDGHPSNGSFRFTVTAAAPGIGATTTPPRESAAVVPATVVSTARNAGPAVAQRSGMDVESPVYVIVRWLSFTGLVLLIGVVAFRLLVLPRIGASPASALARAGTHAMLAATIVPRLATLGIVAGLVVLIAAIGRLLAEQSVMAASMSMGVADIIRRTAWGSAWLVQIGAAIIACAGFALARRRLTTGWGVAAVAAVVLAVTPALSGHAAGMAGLQALAVTTDAVHVLAAGAWLGSLCAMVLVGIPAAMRTETGSTPTNASTGLLADMVNAFSPIALGFAAIVVLTGVISAWLRLGSVAALWRSAYGIVLLVKLALVAGVFGAGAFNWLRMRSALGHAASGDRGNPDASLSANTLFKRSGTFELVFGALVLAATAVLVAMPTPVR